MAIRRSLNLVVAGAASILLSPLIDIAPSLSDGFQPSQDLRLGAPASAGPRYVPRSTARPRYVPRVGNAPRRTLGTGSRGCTDAPAANLTILTPNNDTGATSSSRPSFFWHLSQATATPVEFTLVRPGQPIPIFVKQFDRLEAGITKITLPDTVPELTPGTYRWSVSLVCNPLRRSNDVIAQGWIERVPFSDELDRRIAAAPSDRDRAIIYSESGLWYDALAAFTAALNSEPANTELLQDRLTLLEQGGLSSVVEQERQRTAATALPNAN